jgi:hypothetical protein
MQAAFEVICRRKIFSLNFVTGIARCGFKGGEVLLYFYPATVGSGLYHDLPTAVSPGGLCRSSPGHNTPLCIFCSPWKCSG